MAILLPQPSVSWYVMYEVPCLISEVALLYSPPPRLSTVLHSGEKLPYLPPSGLAAGGPQSPCFILPTTPSTQSEHHPDFKFSFCEIKAYRLEYFFFLLLDLPPSHPSGLKFSV